ncbi:prephenate dehydratase [Sphingoaurantiacus capsulatus]|uniref:prephenate dehydratase n=1 Tax=Sphingoaurantiacus capsulatus TaxID=1771310 RepID=A0ABV7XB40_9SPHN
MENYPKLAHDIIVGLAAAAEADPARAVAFQGAPGAYSHQATRELFPDAPTMPCFSFDEALEAVKTGRAGRAVIPIENSLHGRVADIHFLLPESGLSIVAEHFVRVSHCLLGPKGARREDVREALSHPQALGQARKRLRDWGIKPVAFADTAGAAAKAAELANPGIAAVASRLAAELYDLDILAEAIEDADHNTTRFVVLARDPETPKADGRGLMTTVMFEVRSVPAALFKALGGFATNGVNLTKLESYMRDGSFQAAEFYADIVGSPDDPSIARALDELRYHSRWVRVIGTYPQARARA